MAKATLAQGSTVTLTLSETDSLALNSGKTGSATIEAASGIEGSANRRMLDRHPGGFAKYGPYGAGTVKLGALGGDVVYEVGVSASLLPNTGDSIWATDTSGNVTGLVGPDGGVVAPTWLLPSGGDDTIAVETWVNYHAARGVPALLGPGDFIISGPMVWRSHRVIEKWGNKGIGLTVTGCGAGNTRLLWTPALTTSTNMLTINAPTSAGIGARNYLTKLTGMSFVRAPGGVEIAAGTVDGYGIYGGPAQAGDVIHTPKFKDLFFDGFAYPTTLSDCTLPEFDSCWWSEFLVALRLGYNLDIVKIRHSMFGSEQFGTSYRNNAIAIQGGFSDGFNILGGESIVEVEHTWFMKIGKGFECPDSLDLKGLRFNRCYFEDVRQYFDHVGTANRHAAISFKECHFSKPTTNDTTQSDPLVAGYMAKIQFGGDVAVTGGKQPILTIEDCTSDIVSPANAWVSFNNRDGTINWRNNVMAPSASFGHVRCVRTSFATWRSFPSNSGTYGGTYTLADPNQGGVGVVDGSPIAASATITSGGIHQIDTLAGNIHYLTLPDGDCTIDVFPYTGTAPNRLISTITRFKVILIVPASVTATRTISWSTRIKGLSSLTFSAANQNQRTVLILEGYTNSGSGMMLTSPAPAWFA